MKNKPRLQKILILTDTHRPFHDKKAVALMMKAAKGFKPDRVVIGGDYGDFYSVSAHSKDISRAFQLEKEIADINVGLDEIQTLGAKYYDFIEGNHEDRLRRYLQDKAPELAGQISIPQLFNLEKRGFSFTPYKQTLRLGKLNITHDLGNAGRHAHYKALDTSQANIVINHTHRIGYAVEGSSEGKRHVTAMFGWLGDIKAIDYMHADKARKDWSLGFGIGYIDSKTGYVYLVPVPIVEYTCMIEGVLYKV
jgi:predicted phosphodiesterase